MSPMIPTVRGLCLRGRATSQLVATGHSWPSGSYSEWHLLSDGAWGRLHFWGDRAASFSRWGASGSLPACVGMFQKLGILRKGRGGGCGSWNPAILSTHSHSAWGRGRVALAEAQPSSSLW